MKKRDMTCSFTDQNFNSKRVVNALAFYISPSRSRSKENQFQKEKKKKKRAKAHPLSPLISFFLFFLQKQKNHPSKISYPGKKNLSAKKGVLRFEPAPFRSNACSFFSSSSSYYLTLALPCLDTQLIHPPPPLLSVEGEGLASVYVYIYGRKEGRKEGREEKRREEKSVSLL